MTREEFFKDIRENVCSQMRERFEKVYDCLNWAEFDKGENLPGTEWDCVPFVSPALLDELYGHYLDGRPLEDIHTVIRKVCETLLETGEEEFRMQDMTFEEVKDRIVCHVFSNEMCVRLPEAQVYDDYTYFKALYYAVTEYDDGRVLVVPITNTHLEKWGKDRDDIFDAAMENQLKGGILLLSVDEACNHDVREYGKLNCYDTGRSMVGLEQETIFILTSRSLQFAVSLMLNDRVLSKVRKILGKNFFVLPGSVHEALIIPEKKGILAENVLDYHRDICRGAGWIGKEEMVADEIFYYSGESGQLVRVRKADEKSSPDPDKGRKEIIVQSCDRAIA